ncbi:MAG: AI-2E family transporter [Firmicutes bacterium]|nr:AI-2E family transporter [Bacillota bacterium]
MQIDKKTLRSIFLGIVGCIVLYWLLHETARLMALLKGVLRISFPFLVGAVLAFVLNVPMRGIERCLHGIRKPGIRRTAAILLTFVAVFAVMAGTAVLLLPQIGETVEKLVSTLPAFFTRVQEQVTAYLEEHPEVMEWLVANTDFEKLDVQSLVEKVMSIVSNGFSSALDKTYSLLVSLFKSVFNAVIALVFSLYCMGRKEVLARQGRKLLYAFLPEKVCDNIVRILQMTNRTFSNFISGQCLEAVILGCMFAVAMLVFKMPYIPLVSVVIAVTALVPIVGAWVGCIVGTFFIMVDSMPLALGFVVLFLVLQQIENNLVYPKVVGTSIGLPGMWVLVAVTVGGELMGVFGMLLFIPLASVLYALSRELADRRIAERNIPSEKLQVLDEYGDDLEAERHRNPIFQNIKARFSRLKRK